MDCAGCRNVLRLVAGRSRRRAGGKSVRLHGRAGASRHYGYSATGPARLPGSGEKGERRRAIDSWSPHDGATPAGSGLRLPSNAVQSILRSIAEKVHPIEGLTGYQTAVLLVAGTCVLALLCVLFLASNPAIRFLAKCLLLCVSLTMLYQLSIGGAGSGRPRSDQALQGSGQVVDNIMGHVKTMTEQNYRLQDDRATRQLDQAESSTP